MICRHCGVRTERIEFANPKARVTRRLRQQIGLDCQSMPTSHAAVRHRVSWGKARRAEQAFLTEWDRTRRKRRPRYIGLDEVQRGKGQRFWTVLSDVVRGEVMGLRQDRTTTTATTLLTEDLDPHQRGAIHAVCTDMHRPYLNAVTQVLPQADVVFDKFHVLQHASAALDEVRRQEFFRAGPVMQEACGLCSRVPQFGQSEVKQLRPGLGQHDVGRFEIPVGDALAVGLVQGIRDFDGNLERLVQWQRPLLEPLGQRVALQVFHHQEVDAVLAPDVVERANVRVV